jgi:hypothetical protein
MNHNEWILTCFGLFLISIIVFAFVYYQLHKKNSRRFLFSAEIKLSQRDSFVAEATRRIERLEATIEALDFWALELEKGIPKSSLYEKGEFILPSGRRTRIARWQTPISVSGFSTTVFVCNVWDESGTLRLEEKLPTSLIFETYSKKSHEQEQQFRRSQVASLKQQLSSLSLESGFVWSFWDFLYFSAISQTTVGYGDILPNATVVRLLVVSQILVGYAILVVLLNVLLGRVGSS